MLLEDFADALVGQAKDLVVVASDHRFSCDERVDHGLFGGLNDGLFAVACSLKTVGAIVVCLVYVATRR